MRIPVSKELKAVIEDTLAPCLKSHGFSRRGNDFLRPVEDQLVQVVSVQKSQYSSAAHVSWTLNIAVFAPELAEIRGFLPAEKTPAASGCFLSVRVADLLPREGVEREFWYELGSDGFAELLEVEPDRLRARYSPLKPDTLRRVLRADLEEAVLPHLDAVRNRQALYQFSRSGRCPMAGPLDWIALELALGKHDEARNTWRTHLPDRKDVKEYAQARFGVSL
jgi:hypothetical protein